MRLIYKINYARLVMLLLPIMLRKPKMYAWLMCLLEPLFTLYINFLKYRDSKNYELQITPQVCYLEKLLNDRFDNEQRRIYITEKERIEPTFLALKIENLPLFCPIYIGTQEEINNFSFDFTIIIPSDLNSYQIEIKSLINKFKLAGKRFNVIN